MTAHDAQVTWPRCPSHVTYAFIQSSISHGSGHHAEILCEVVVHSEVCVGGVGYPAELHTQAATNERAAHLSSGQWRRSTHPGNAANEGAARQ